MQPNQTFYSVWPTKNMVKNELVALRDEGFEVLQCSQNAGDLLLVGQSWGEFITAHRHPHDTRSIGLLDIAVNLVGLAVGAYPMLVLLFRSRNSQPTCNHWHGH